MGAEPPGCAAPGGVSVERVGEGPRRQPAELRVWSLLVVVAPPILQHRSGVAKRAEQGLVEQLVAQAAVETLIEAILLGLARRDVTPANAGLVGPAQDGVRGQLRAVTRPEAEVQERLRSALPPSSERAQQAVTAGPQSLQ